MHKISALEHVLQDPQRSDAEKQVARAALRKIQNTDVVAAPLGHDAARLEGELLRESGASDLSHVAWLDAWQFCNTKGWQQAGARELYFDRWLPAYFTTDEGKASRERIARYMREHDFEEWRVAGEEWKDSGFKDSARLIRVLGLIADSPNRGNYHHADTVTGAAQFLAEIRRRAGAEGQ